MNSRPDRAASPVSASVIGPVEREVSRALNRDVLYPGEAHLVIRDLGIIGPRCTIISGQYAAPRDLDDRRP